MDGLRMTSVEEGLRNQAAAQGALAHKVDRLAQAAAGAASTLSEPGAEPVDMVPASEASERVASEESCRALPTAPAPIRPPSAWTFMSLNREVKGAIFGVVE